eukprot:scaffold42457_cov68-Phaeocystis_antarctica.AAC.9
MPAGASTRLSSLHSIDWAGVVCSSAPPPSLTQRTRPVRNFASAAPWSHTTALQQFWRRGKPGQPCPDARLL